MGKRPVLEAATPAMFVLMLLEYVAVPGAYRLNDAISSVSAGGMDMLVSLLWAEALSGPYLALRDVLQRHGLALDLSHSVLGLVALVVLIDLSYYLGHRAAHMVSVCWAGHGVHHSSEEYNLTTAMRQGALEKLFSLGFRLYLAFFVPLTTYQTLFDFNLLYQYWVHTTAISKMPWWYEAVFVTPSHHRVHHARNPGYLDKNFSGFLIIWDRLFGTFAEEREKPVYGLVHPLQTFNPIAVQFDHLRSVLMTAWATPDLRGKLAVLFAPPAYDVRLGRRVQAPDIDPHHKKYDPVLPPRAKLWAAVTMLLVQMPAYFLYITAADSLSHGLRIAGALLLMANLWALGLVLDRTAPAMPLEALRLSTSALYAWFAFGTSPWLLGALASGLLVFARLCQ